MLKSIIATDTLAAVATQSIHTVLYPASTWQRESSGRSLHQKKSRKVEKDLENEQCIVSKGKAYPKEKVQMRYRLQRANEVAVF